jgi:hypothetical protein
MSSTENPNISRVLVQGSNPTTPETNEKFHLLATDHWPLATAPPPTNNLSEPEHTNPKTFVEICISVEQKILPIHTQLPQHQQKTPPTAIPYGTSEPKKRGKMKIRHPKNSTSH